MSIIPINPSTIQKAQPYTTPLAGYVAAIFEKPITNSGKAQRGERYVPMQFNFSTTPVWLVDLSNVSALHPFTKCASLYIDASNSSHDINILFPDSGWQTRIPFGATAMVNPISGKALPKFYVILDDGSVNNATDVVNITAIDTFMPPSLTAPYQRTVAYGYGPYFALQPAFTQGTAFIGDFANPNVSGVIIPNTQWYISAAAVNFNVQTPSGDSTNWTITLVDGGVGGTVFAKFFATNSESQNVVLSNLNYISSGNGSLVASLAASGAPLNWEVAVTVFGGVLVT